MMNFVTTITPYWAVNIGKDQQAGQIMNFGPFYTCKLVREEGRGKGDKRRETTRKDDRRTDGRTDGPTDGRTDGPTDGWTDTPSYGHARTHLKNGKTRQKERR